MSTEAFASSSFVPQSPSHWVHDSARHSCRSCRTSFSLIKRRHHCRSCREVFCDGCSSFRLKSRSRREPNLIVRVRVCQPCFEKYKGKRRIRAAKTPRAKALSPSTVATVSPDTGAVSTTVKLDSASIPSVVKDDNDGNPHLWYHGHADSGSDDVDELPEDDEAEHTEEEEEEDDDESQYSTNYLNAMTASSTFTKELTLPSAKVHDVTVALENRIAVIPAVHVDKATTEYSYTPTKTEDGFDRTTMGKEVGKALDQKDEWALPTFEHTVVSEEAKPLTEMTSVHATSQVDAVAMFEQQKEAEAAVNAAGIEEPVIIQTEQVAVTEVASPASAEVVNLTSPATKVPTPLLDLLNADTPKPQQIAKLVATEKARSMTGISEETETGTIGIGCGRTEMQDEAMTVNVDGPEQPQVVLRTVDSGLLSPTSAVDHSHWPAGSSVSASGSAVDTSNDANVTATSNTVNFNNGNMHMLVASPNAIRIAEIDTENENWPVKDDSVSEASVLSTQSASPVGQNAMLSMPPTPLEQPQKRVVRRVVGVRKLSWSEKLMHPVPLSLMGVLLAVLAVVILPVTLFLLVLMTGIALATPFFWPHLRHYVEQHAHPPLAVHFDFLPKTQPPADTLRSIDSAPLSAVRQPPLQVANTVLRSHAAARSSPAVPVV